MIRKNRYFIFFIILIMFSYGCKLKTNEEIISLLQKEFKEYNNGYQKMITVLFSLNLNNKNCIIGYNKNLSLIVKDYNSGGFFYDYNPNIGKGLSREMYKKKCKIKVTKNKNIEFIYRHRNMNDDKYRLIYYILNDVNYKELYPDFEIVKGVELPKRNGGWIYVINPQWIIYSPHKTEKKDNPVIKWLSNYIIFSVIAGIIFLIVKRFIKKGKQ